MKNEPTLQNLADFENKSLLIVDDDNPFRERLARAMEKKGFTVTQAESVKIGIETVRSQSPAFAVVDLRLNDGNCLLYTSDAADDLLCVDLGGRRNIKKSRST